MTPSAPSGSAPSDTPRSAEPGENPSDATTTRPSTATAPVGTTGRPGEGSTPTSLSLTARTVLTRTRGPLLALVLLLATAVTIAVVRSGDEHGRLDPRSADRQGSRALATLLEERGVDSRTVTTTAEASAAAGPDTTLLVTSPGLLTTGQQHRLREAVAGSGGRTVLVAPGPEAVTHLTPGTTTDPVPALDTALRPGCELPAARRAGKADTGGLRYATAVPGADSCYRSDGLATVLRIPEPADGDTVLLGSPAPLLNENLDERGNAALTLGLLGSRPHVVWYLPSLSDPAGAATDGERSFFDLIPSGWLWGALQLTLAAVAAALWRARRFGRLVPEPLPVAVRASETTEGRARLYHRADARDRAADALRSGTRNRIAPLLGLAPSRAHSPEHLLPALSARLPGPGRDPQLLLFGPPPGDDAALVRLADHLDALESEVRAP